MNSSRPIGIFDSGVGGLTVARRVIRDLPDEQVIYLGDTARVPYGTRGRKVIKIFALELARTLLERDVKCLVVACNSISASCFEDIESISPVPVIGVIEPTAGAAVSTTETGRVGIIGTPATIRSQAYERHVQREPGVRAIARSCPLFVPLVEAGLTHHQATELIARDYLVDFMDGAVDTLILGCTHYPVLRDVIQHTVGPDVTLIDSAGPISRVLVDTLRREKLLAKPRKSVRHEFLFTDVSDAVHHFTESYFDARLKTRIHKTTVGAEASVRS